MGGRVTAAVAVDIDINCNDNDALRYAVVVDVDGWFELNWVRVAAAYHIHIILEVESSFSRHLKGKYVQ